ncbi:hypothetical protein KIN20_002946 [Parelaphostrongylus tenuis]|uniref:Uncharacterized protein n=1 Tax=Parelaphostrongylus tenuis TaxID=148309 RepID=A0AAD5QDB0_PARTN|nr:hypothetical protein KIN20_002946 [Parelaphostrongylus tenuis]
MITANATAVGCYYDFCENRASAACVFSQPEPQHEALVYTSGSPCTTGGNCTLPKTGVCEFGLCVNTA